MTTGTKESSRRFVCPNRSCSERTLTGPVLRHGIEGYVCPKCTSWFSTGYLTERVSWRKESAE